MNRPRWQNNSGSDMVGGLLQHLPHPVQANEKAFTTVGAPSPDSASE